MLTKRDIDTLAAPSSGSKITYDGRDGLAGFGVRITAAGAKSFVLNYRAAGTERRLTIGSTSTWTLAAARARAKELRREVDAGRDPLAEKITEREAPRVRDLAHRYVDEHLAKLRPATRRDVEGQLARWILPELGSLRVADVRPADIEKLHAKVTKAGSPIRANRCIATLSKMMSLAARWEMRAENTNPAKGAIERNAETKRKRYLSPAEFSRLSEALAAYPHKAPAYAIGLLVATGARRMEVLAADWNQFNLPARTWLKPASNTKQKADHFIPLNATAVDLLERLEPAPERRTGYLFPGRDGTGHLTDLKHPWGAICRAAGFDDVRLHDLRHSFASAAVSSGATLPEIAGLLGHSNSATASRYSHLYIDRLREVSERVGGVASGK